MDSSPKRIGNGLRFNCNRQQDAGRVTAHELLTIPLRCPGELAQPPTRNSTLSRRFDQTGRTTKGDAEQMQKMMSANDKEGMGMCRMMGCDPDGKHSHHH